MTTTNAISAPSAARLENPNGLSNVVFVCEHASHFIPEHLNNLGLANVDRQSHAAWDPGALTIAQHLSAHFDAPLVASNISRLVYDCNRPPDAPDAMPKQSERITVPGNANLSPTERQDRVVTYYTPFRALLADTLATKPNAVVITLHSFTPVYNGAARPVQIGVLHDSDTRLADALLAHPPRGYDVQRNQPYGPEHGVTHTLKEHALSAGHLNVMLEIRNDLLVTETQQTEMANTLANWLAVALDMRAVDEAHHA